MQLALTWAHPSHNGYTLISVCSMHKAHTSACPCICMHARICIFANNLMHAFTHTNECTQAHILEHIIHTHAHAHSHTHTHTLNYARTSTQPRLWG